MKRLTSVGILLSARHATVTTLGLLTAVTVLVGQPASAATPTGALTNPAAATVTSKATGCTTQARYLRDGHGDVPSYVIPTGVSRSGYVVGRVAGDGAPFITPDTGELFTVF